MKRKLAYLIGAGILFAGGIVLERGYNHYIQRMEELEQEELKFKKGIYVEERILRELERGDKNIRESKIDLTKIV